VNTLPWTYDRAQRVAARNEILQFLQREGEANTVAVAAGCQHFQNEPLVIVLNFLQGLEKEGKVASELHSQPESHYTWQLTARGQGCARLLPRHDAAQSC
jgi:hypothetical protein